MEDFLPFAFRGFFYVLFGLTLEVVFAASGIELCLGEKLKKQTPHKYLEGFTSLYMIPVHLFGMYFGFEWMASMMSDFHIILRYLIWALLITGTEALMGFIMHKTLGFYTWDYYKISRFKVFKEGYTLWTLFPLWGVAGLILEIYSSLLITLTPYALNFFR